MDPAFYRSLGSYRAYRPQKCVLFLGPEDHVHLVIGYRFVGQLNGPARRLLDPDKITWSQVTDADLSTGRSEVRMVPDNYQGLLSFSAWYEFRGKGEDQCSQHFEGDLRVRLPSSGRGGAGHRGQHPPERRRNRPPCRTVRRRWGTGAGHARRRRPDRPRPG